MFFVQLRIAPQNPKTPVGDWVLINHSVQMALERYNELLELNRKTHICGFYFRQRCVKTKQQCYHAHGLADLKRVDQELLLRYRTDLFNLKHSADKDPSIKRPKYTPVFNIAQKKYEVMKSYEVLGVEKDGEDDSEEEEEKQPLEGKPLRNGLSLDQYTPLTFIEDPHMLYLVDSDRNIFNDDEVNIAARKLRIARTKEEYTEIKDWQNTLMGQTFLLFGAESVFQYKHEVTQKFNEIGMPLTWYRLQKTNIMFEKSVVLPPWSEKVKQSICLPMKSQEENLERCEELLTRIVF